MTMTDDLEVPPSRDDTIAEPTKARFDPQAAAELAQELTLVARALFAQLLPDAAAYALSGLPSIASQVTGIAAAGQTTDPASPQVGTVDMLHADSVAPPHGLAVPSTEASTVVAPAPVATPDVHMPGALPVAPVPTESLATVPKPAAVHGPPIEVPAATVPRLEVPALDPVESVPSVDAPAPTGPPTHEIPALDVPSIDMPQTCTIADTDASPTLHPSEPASRSPHRPDRSMAVLAEIGFLDE